MIICAIYQTTTGAISQISHTIDINLVLAVCSADQGVTEVDATVSDHTHYIASGSPVAIPAQPNPAFSWDWATHTWMDARSLVDSRKTKSAEIKVSALLANQGTFNFQGKAFQCDELGRSNIDGMNGIITLLNALPSNWLGTWKAADNTYLPIPDLATWVSFYGAMVAQGQANFVHSQALKSKIAGATSNADIDAISWNTVTQ